MNISDPNSLPFGRSPNDQQQGFIRQSVQLTGFNTEKFQTCVDTLQCLHQALARQVLEGAMDPFTVGQNGRFDTVEFSTHYFTARQDDPFGDAILFNNAVDPKGVLASMTDDTYFHGGDNEVMYFTLRHNEDGHSQ
jgi:hypothetical protein